MALGNNLRKKKLIPEADGEQQEEKKQKKVVKNEKTKKAVSGAKEVTSSPKKKAATPSKKAVAKKKKLPTAPQKPKEKVEAGVAKPQDPPTITKDEVVETPEPISPAAEAEPQAAIETVNVSAPMSNEFAHNTQSKNHEQIISAYSIYIAQELFERKKILRERYIKEVVELKGKAIQVIVITVGTEKYALDIDCVKEVVPIPTISKTPNTPEHIKGVANVRGTTYAVFDLATKFQVIGQEVPRYLLVLSSRELKSGLPLSSLPTNFKTNGDQITHSLQTIEDALIDASYIKGIIKNEQELIYYLDIEELLKNDKAIVIPDNLVEEKL